MPGGVRLEHRRPVRGREGAAGAGGGGGEPVRGGLVRRSRLRHRAGLAGRSGGGGAALHVAAGAGHRRDAARACRAPAGVGAADEGRGTSRSSTRSRCGSASGCGRPPRRRPTRRTRRRPRRPGRSGCCRCSRRGARRSGNGWTRSSPASPGTGSASRDAEGWSSGTSAADRASLDVGGGRKAPTGARPTRSALTASGVGPPPADVSAIFFGTR